MIVPTAFGGSVWEHFGEDGAEGALGQEGAVPLMTNFTVRPHPANRGTPVAVGIAQSIAWRGFWNESIPIAAKPERRKR